MFTDIKLSLRALLKTPGFTAIAVLMLALGIGANTAIFSMVKAVLLSPLPYQQPEQLVWLWEDAPNFSGASISWPDLQDWQTQNRSFSAIGGMRQRSFRLENVGEPEMLGIAQANAELFDALKISPLSGRLFTSKEDIAGAPALVVLSHSFWQRKFSGRSDVLGQSLTLNGSAYTIVGVQRPELGIQYPTVDAWTQLGRLGDQPEFQDRQNHPGINGIGRMKPGVTFEQAMADLRTISAQIQKAHPEMKFMVTAGGALLADNTAQGFKNLWILQGAVAIVLLIACANLTGLLLARGLARDSELAVKAALGASRLQLMRQLLLESLMLAACGGALGLLLAYWTVDVIDLFDLPGSMFLERTRIDAGVLAVNCALSLGTALIAGLWPAWKFTRPNLSASMHAGSRGGSEDRKATRTREGLIVAEVALTLLLVTSAGLLLKSFFNAQSVDLGFNPHGILSARLELPPEIYGTEEKNRLFSTELLTRLRALPGVESADIAIAAPLNRMWQTMYTVDGQQATVAGQLPMAEMNIVSDSYFETFQVPLLRGRGFGPEDTAGGEKTVIIDQATAQRHWPNQDPIGKIIKLGTSLPLKIVGVVPTLRLYGYAVEPKLLQAYMPLRQTTFASYSLLVRTKHDPTTLITAVRRAVLEVDPNQPLWDIRTFDDRINSTFSATRFFIVLLAAFAGLALLLAAIGLYGLLAFQVVRRTREFGIRIALGAVHQQVMALVLKSGLKLLAIGVLLGIAAAAGTGRLMSSLLYQTSPFDPVVVTGAVLLLGFIALLACWLPARRAMKVDPLVALRAE